MMKNEEGFVLPLFIAITFVVAYLLLMLATQIEIKVSSYERTRNYMVMNLLEREGLEKLEYFLATGDMNDDFSHSWVLRNGAIMRINATRGEGIFVFYYQIVYNECVRSRNLSVFFEEGRTFLD